MSPGETIDVALQAYRQLGWPMLKSTLVAAALGTAALIFLWTFAIPGFFTTTKPGDLQVELGEAVVSLLLGLGVAVPLILLAVGLSSVLITQLAADFMIGAPLNLKLALETTRKLWLKVALALGFQALIASLGILVALLMLVISGSISGTANDPNMALSGAIGMLAVGGFIIGGLWMLYCFSRGCLAIPSMVVEGKSARDSLRRSNELYSARGGVEGASGSLLNLWGLIFLVLIFFSIGVSALVGVLSIGDFYAEAVRGLAYRAVLERVFEMVPLFFAFWFLIPLWGTACTIIYFERRVRLEGFDVEVLAQEVWKRSKGARFQL